MYLNSLSPGFVLVPYKSKTRSSNPFITHPSFDYLMSRRRRIETHSAEGLVCVHPGAECWVPGRSKAASSSTCAPCEETVERSKHQCREVEHQWCWRRAAIRVVLEDCHSQEEFVLVQKPVLIHITGVELVLCKCSELRFVHCLQWQVMDRTSWEERNVH